uniref:FP protein C-terminal domain-containing protein n=1 Tax=Photinus pyralis TaxID=7054 RepID=A0A1Y1LGC7_PHOPY
MPYVLRSQGQTSTMAGDNIELEPSNKDIMTLLLDLKNSQSSREEEMIKSLNACHEKLDLNSLELTKINLRLDAYSELLEKLKNENQNLRKELTSCALEIDKLEQYTRRNTIEIHGIPYVNGEDTYVLVQQVATALSVPVSKNAIDICHRLRTQAHKPSPILCKFVNRYVKEEIIARRKVKRNLSTSDIGMTSGDTIYVNENLTSCRRKLLFRARQTQKEIGFKFLWTKNGFIYARKDEKSPITEINSTEDIERIKAGAL